MIKRKAISPVVAVALLIVVSVVAVIGFQGWFQTYSSEMFVKTETESQETSNTQIEALVGDQLYFKNFLGDNLTIKQIKIGNRECNISTNVSPGVKNISLGSCVDNLTLSDSIGDIIVITDKKIYTKKHLFKDVTIVSSSSESLESVSGNYFGNESDGNILVNSSGVYQDLGSGYSLHPDTTGTEWNSVEDGDMVVINAQDFKVASGVTFTTTNRCRGLMIYATGDVTINGTISMTARGAHANPADSSVTVNTPVAPSDGNSVSNEGLVIRRAKSNWSDINSTIISNAHASTLQDFNDTHNSSDLFYGSGIKAVTSESNQAEVEEGLVIKIPKIGGVGGIGANPSSASIEYGSSGNSKLFSFGGGGGGGADVASGLKDTGGSGSNSTCFSSGTGGGASYANGEGVAENGFDYGGSGGSGYQLGGYSAGGGAGNPGGIGANAPNGQLGTGGLLIINSKNNLILNLGSILSSQGSNGGGTTSNWAGGGASGGGSIILLYGNNSVNQGVLNVNGGIGGGGGSSNQRKGGDGGKGSIIGPIQIDR